ncbi:molybdopterin oxidoreductase family protein [Nocardioides sp. ChNu-153]|uniref:molybdopterin oxidoreductase family protein n=1 Tax=Nocardioides sp. ChNu-153 TaxID=2779364 RepID=UPI00264A6553|nr:molybdopterin oxidoreductase family protein [Nocardioides sp. ChNu-153]MDN7123082.1 molybdopterin oxidoreductase family protein [Nocardioides sp. ChNu-153]
MTTSHCPYCSLQCGMTLTREGRSLAVGAWEAFPVNEGALCRKGWTAAGLRGHRERLTTPLVRDRAADGTRGELRPATWDEALDLVADRLTAIRAEDGPDAVAVFGAGGLTNEKGYQLGKFARVALGTSQIDYNGRWCMSSAASAGLRALGLDRGLPFPLADVERADVLVLAGSNLAETAPPAARHLDRLRERGGRVVVVDPRRTPTADRADLHLAPVPGTDLALALGVLHLVVAAGAVDEEYVAARTSGFDAVRRSVTSWWPERVERITGVAADEVRALADLLIATAARGGRVMVLTARGVEQHSQGSDTVLAWINVALALGMPGREGAGYGCLTGQGNGQGGREHGQKADQLPGYRLITDPAARAHVAGVWGVEPDSLPGKGRSAYELLEALGTPDGPRALLVHGSNIVVSAPNATHVTERLAALDLLVVADLVLSETAAMADVVLPVTQWAEETGTMTNLEGRVVLRQRALTPPEGVRTDLEVIAGLAERLGSPVPFATDPEEVFTELGRASAGGPADYSGITYDRIRAEHGVFWPCPATEDATDGTEGAPHPGTPRLFADRFGHPDGRARFLVTEFRGAAEQPCADYPLHLTTGRVLGQYQSGAQTRRVKELPDTGPFVELHPQLARRLGTADGELLTVRTRRGAMRAPARVVATIRPDTVFVPFHWVGANRLTNDALDPASRMPEFKVCAAAVSA